MTQAFAKQLWSGVIMGYGIELAGLAYDSPDGEMLMNLQKNVYAFSAAKNWQQMKALTQALIDNDNKLRTYSQFKKEAFAINDTHVKQWLKTEYDTAIGSGQMARKWVEIQKNKASLPMLQFDAVMDGRTSDICRPLDGITRPVDDPFWNQYYPPNHFGCRSTVRQQSGGKATDLTNFSEPEKIPAMFKVNLAERGLAFPPTHAYWMDIPKKELERSLKWMPKPTGFITIKEFANGGSIKIHPLVNVAANDYDKVYSCCEHFAKEGEPTFILPDIKTKTDPEYLKIFGELNDTKYQRKCPDFKVGKLFWEHEGHLLNSNSDNWLSNMLTSGFKQSSRLVIDQTNDTDRKVLRNINKRIYQGQEIDEVWILNDGKMRLIYKKTNPQ